MRPTRIRSFAPMTPVACGEAAPSGRAEAAAAAAIVICRKSRLSIIVLVLSAS
jgi:hypothetical protein